MSLDNDRATGTGDKNAIPAWHSISSFLASYGRLEKARFENALRIANVLKRTCNMEPFLLDFSACRIFAPPQEGRYSDQLAWLLQQPIWDQGRIFDLLNIDGPIREKLMGIPPEVKREVPVEKGHEDQGGQIDILLLWKNVLVDIEVKKVAAEGEGADIEKNDGYRESLKKKYPNFNHYHRLLVTDARKKCYNCKPEDENHRECYMPITWELVCIYMRRLVYDGSPTNDPLLMSQLLSFAGTVEQCLLGYKFLDHNRCYVDQKSLSHLQRLADKCIDQEVPMSNPEEETFFQEGIGNYVAARRAAKRFEEMVSFKAKEVLKAKRPLLWEAMKLDAKSIPDIQVYDGSHEDPDGEEAYIGVTVGVAGYGRYDVMACCGGDKKNWAYVSLSNIYADLRDRIMEEVRRMQLTDVFFDDSDPKEVYQTKQLKRFNGDTFSKALEDLLDQWIKFWQGTKGIESLLNDK
jgi:hypothetical protein